MKSTNDRRIKNCSYRRIICYFQINLHFYFGLSYKDIFAVFVKVTGMLSYVCKNNQSNGSRYRRGAQSSVTDCIKSAISIYAYAFFFSFPFFCFFFFKHSQLHRLPHLHGDQMRNFTQRYFRQIRRGTRRGHQLDTTPPCLQKNKMLPPPSSCKSQALKSVQRHK